MKYSIFGSFRMYRRDLIGDENYGFRAIAVWLGLILTFFRIRQSQTAIAWNPQFPSPITSRRYIRNEPNIEYFMIFNKIMK